MSGRHARTGPSDTTALGRWCRDSGVTHRELAKRVGIARSTLQLVATGRAIPSGKHALALAGATGLSLEALLRGQDAAETTQPVGAVERDGGAVARDGGAMARDLAARRKGGSR